MKLSKFAPVVLALLVAGTAIAALTPEQQAFGNGPARYLMTKNELKQWKNISSDNDAQAFIDLFWARRDPTPATPQNEYKADFDALVQLADKQFTFAPTAGSMTDRGRLLILLGTPTKIVRSRAAAAQGIDEEEGGGGAISTETWLYSGESLPKFAKGNEFSILFRDDSGKGDYRLAPFGQKVNVNDLTQKAIDAAITSPNMKEVPKYAQAQPAPKPVPAAPPVSKGLTSDALKAAVEEVKAGTATYPKAAITWDEFVTPAGTHYVPVGIYLPKSLGLTSDSAATFFGVVTDATGNVVASYEEPAKLIVSKNDLFFDRSLTLAPGKYTAILGLATDGKPVVASSLAMDVTGREKDTVGISKMILSNNIYPLTAAQAPTDPYSFGGIKVIPKADYVFTKADDLWYFFELQNPGLDPATNAPKVQVKLDLEGITGKDKVKDKVKMGAPLSEAPAEALKGVPGHYGVGSSIPLATFKPGDYTIKIKVIDTVTKQTYNMEQSFKIVGEK